MVLCDGHIISYSILDQGGALTEHEGHLDGVKSGVRSGEERGNLPLFMG